MERYKATWESLDARTLPAWYDEAKIGIFLHWGIYSVPGYAPRRSEVDFPDKAYAEWYAYYVGDGKLGHGKFQRAMYPGGSTYQDLAAQWNPVLFDADEWMKLFKYAGAKYFVPTAKHHDGFCLYDSKYSQNWNSVCVGPKRDIISELMEACDRQGIVRGMYYSLLEWFHPVMQNRQKGCGDVPKYAEEKMLPQLKELIETFKPHILFADGSWDYTSDMWKSKEFLAWLYNDSSVKDTVAVNDRWGSDTIAAHGGFYTSEYEFINSQAMSEAEARAAFLKHKFSEGRSVGYSFGWNRNEHVEDYLTEDGLINLIVDVISRGGNFMLNVGPAADGTLTPLVEERLRQMGDWMKVNGEGIYKSSTVKISGLPDFAKATRVGDSVYVFCSKYPKEPMILQNALFGESSRVELLGSGSSVEGSYRDGAFALKAPLLTVDELPCRCVYTFKIASGKQARQPE